MYFIELGIEIFINQEDRIMKQKTYIVEYNIIRVIATLLVVIGHAGYISPMTKWGGISFGNYSVPVMQQIIDLGIRLIYSFHMPLFFALSGALFHLSIEENKFCSIKDVLIVKSKRLLVPYVLCTFLWVVPIKALSGYWSTSKSIFKDIIFGQFFLYGNSHLWFLWVLFIVTTMTWIFRKSEITRVFIALFFFCCGCTIDAPQFGISQIFLNLIWFELGYQYGKYRNTIQKVIDLKERKIVLAIISIMIYLTVLICYLRLAKGSEFAYGILHLTGVVMSFSLAFLIDEKKLRNRLFYRSTLRHSMGIYLFSDSINYLILSILKNITGDKIVETNVGAIGLFIFRICLTILIAIVIDIVVQKCRENG